MTVMHCPNCGTNTSLDKKFCRNCGFGLEKVSQLIAEELPHTALENRDGLKEPKHLMERLASIGGWLFVSGGVALFGLVIYGIVSHFIIAKGQVVFGLALILFLAGVALMLAQVYYTETQKDSGNRKRQQPVSLPEGDANQKHLPEYSSEAIPSVTERTTQLFESDEPVESEARRAPGQRTERQ